jgi:hypothetical protein
MKNITGNFTFLFTILIICVSQVLDAQDITGDWYGVWQEPDSFHITLHIYKDHRGLHALMDRPMTMTLSDPIDEITFEKDTLLFYHAGLNFHYKGCPDQDFSRIYGEMTQSGHSYTLNFGRSRIKRIMPVDEG